MKKTITPFLFVILISLFHIGKCQVDTSIQHFPTKLMSFEEEWINDGESPAYWKILNSRSSTSSSWERGKAEYYEISFAHSGDYSCFIRPDNNGKDLDDWLISPQYALPTDSPIILNFFATASGNNGAALLEVYISTTNHEISNFTDWVGTYELYDYSTYESTKRVFDSIEINLESYKGKQIYIGFRAVTKGGQDAILLLDDIQLYSADQKTPSPIYFSNIGYNSATAYWQRSSDPPYELVYSTKALKDPSSEGIKHTVNDTFALLDNLTSSKKYYVYLKTKGSDYVSGRWEGPHLFSTNCLRIESSREADTSKYYIADFSDLTCWAILDKKGVDTWKEKVDFSGKSYMQYNLENEYGGSDDWLISPEIYFPSNKMLTINYEAANEWSPEFFSIWYIKDTSDILVDAIQLLPARKYYYKGDGLQDSLIVDLTAIAGKVGRLAIRQESQSYYSTLNINGFTIENAYSCMPIEDLQVSNRTDSEVSINWTGRSAQYEIKLFDTEVLHPESATPIDSGLTSDHFYSFSQLLPGKSYSVYVRARCSDESQSQWRQTSFRSISKITHFPYEETFDSWSIGVQPNNTGDWNVFDGNGDMNTFQGKRDYQQDGIAAGFRSWTSTEFPKNRNQWLFSPLFCLGDEQDLICSFLVKTYQLTDIEQFSILISTTNLDTSSFKALLPNVEVSTNGTYKPIQIDLSSYQGQKIYIAIKLHSKVSTHGFLLDDFQIKASKNPPPKEFKIDSSSSKSISLSWLGSSSSYRLAYQKYLFNPQNGNESILLPLTEGKNIIIDNLSSGSQYYIFIQSIYGEGETSEWVGPISATTACDQIQLPFIETFDGWLGSEAIGKTENPLGCWKYNNLMYPFPEEDPANSLLLVFGYPDDGTPWENGVGVSIMSYEPSDTLDKFLISPQFRMPTTGSTLSYWIGAVYSKVHYEIKLSTSGNKPEDFIYSIISDSLEKKEGTSNSTWEKRVIHLSDKSNNLFPDSLVYVAFILKGKNDLGSGSSIRIDDITIAPLIPSCSTPDSVKSIHINESDILITWKSSAPNFELRYFDKMFNPIENPYIGNSIFCEGNLLKGETVLENLQAGQEIYVWIRGLCPSDQTTLWMGPFTLLGGCAAIINQYPYLYDFSQFSLNSLPSSDLCWKSISYNGSGFVGNTVGSKNSQRNPSMAAYSAYHSQVDYLTGVIYTDPLPAGETMNSWLISPQIKLNADKNQILKFNYRINDRHLQEKFYVLVSTTTSNTSSFTDTLAVIDCLYMEEFMTFTASLQDFKGDSIFLAIVHRTKNESIIPVLSELIIDDISIENLNCPYIESMQIGEVDPLSDKALLSWEGNTNGSWTIRHSNKLFNPYTAKYWDYQEEIIEDRNEYELLAEKSTSRVFYIASSDCGVFTFWQGPYFIQSCDENISSFPYIERFENWTDNPKFSNCWENKDLDRDGVAFSTNQGGRNFSQSLRIKNSLSEPMQWNNCLISNNFNLTDLEQPILEFWARAAYKYNETIRVFVSTIENPTFPSDFTLLDTLLLEDKYWQYPSGIWDRFYFNLYDYTGKAHVRIAIQHASEPSLGCSLFIDDLSIKDMGACATIDKVEIDSISPSSATISWSTNLPTDAFIIKYQKDAFPYDDPSPYPTAPLQDTTTEATIHLNHLEKGSEYFYYLSPLCNTNDENPWYGPFEFKTDCATIENMPYSEDFDTWTPLQNRNFGCWNVLDNNQDHQSFKVATDPWSYTNYLEYRIDTGKVSTSDDWLLSPAILLPHQPIINFTFCTGLAMEKMVLMIGKKSEVRKSNGEFDLSGFDTLQLFHLIYSWDSLYTLNQETTEKLLNYIGKEVYLAFHVVSDYDEQNGNLIKLDLFSVSSESPCSIKPKNLRVDPSITSASVSWEGNAALWEVEYWTHDSNERFLIDSVSRTQLILSNLMPNQTKYHVRIRAMHCNEIEAIWSDTKDFLTESSCKPPSSVSIIVGIDTAKLIWTSGSTEPDFAYLFNWKKEGGEFSETDILYTKDTILRNLTSDTEYEFTLRKICSTGDTSTARVETFRTYYPCPKPLNIEMKDQRKRSITLSWVNPKTSKHLVRYKLTSDSIWLIDSVERNFITLSLLNPGSTYNCNIQAVCHEGNLSETSEVLFSTLNLVQYSLSLLTNNTNYGTVEGGGFYDEESLISIRAKPREGYEFQHWEDINGRVISNEKNHTLQLISDTILRAVFIKHCMAPSRLTILSVNCDSTLLTWEAAADSYLVCYKIKDDTTWDSLQVREKYIILRDLKDFHTYDWKIKALCQGRSSEEVFGPSFIPLTVEQGKQEQIRLLIKPNPVNRNGLLQIQKEGDNMPIDIAIFDLFGRKVRQKSRLLHTSMTVDLRGLPSGVYLIQINGSGWSRTERFVIE